MANVTFPPLGVVPPPGEGTAGDWVAPPDVTPPGGALRMTILGGWGPPAEEEEDEGAGGKVVATPMKGFP